MTKQTIFTLWICLNFISAYSFAESFLYRYTNDQGVKVLDHSIPPEFAQKGYEILSTKGRLIRKVAPAPTEEEISKRSIVNNLREKYEILKRRYSSPEDIVRAKKRRLRDIDTSVAILRGNIGSAKGRIEELMNKAATTERQGRQVPSIVLQQMEDARSELSIAEAALATRLKEAEEIAKKYEKDSETFIAGSQLENELAGQEK